MVSNEVSSENGPDSKIMIRKSAYEWPAQLKCLATSVSL